jgi:hypothetical protein
MVGQNGVLCHLGGNEKRIDRIGFRRRPRGHRCIETTADPEYIPCFHMVGKKRFLGSQVMRSIGRQKTGKVFDGKTGWLWKKALSFIEAH